MQKIIKICFFSLLSLSALAYGPKTFDHPTCKVMFHSFEKVYSWDVDLVARIKKNFTSRGYKVSFLNAKKEITPGDFHLKIKRTLTGKLYKTCLLEAKLRTAKAKIASEGDPVAYEMEKSRNFPRQTFKGRERCYLAADDLFFNLDICKTSK